MGAKPIAQGPQKKNCPQVISSGCVIWDGDDVPCLGICKGMRMTDAMYKEMVLTCSLLNQLIGAVSAIGTPPPPIDFSVLNFGCAWTPTITTWVCPSTQVFVPSGTGTPPGYCGILGPVGTGVFVAGVGWISAATSAVPVMTVVPNPIPKPTTLIEVLQVIIDDIPCCDPCSNINAGG